ncbi:hypothetical protein A2764_00110 [Candidatus Kaiserbacteria bacterium RIFCSPHIGHO2_01_FULL_55_79]|nr:MAG: hypothetical protein A2764_00110 [Candidatus Kaiserbacteria bacterium RIFCSPHIGHO2_01_FULL_55_79]OGG78211.1 MAG: hypothetical protein A3F56_00145 [Candidatus Kaiserbacteria bacterium RIFCSPHIGHO2_12_FULL_55_13]OGG82741.1 MAG: hypothetical protein A3A42_02650 [Candidatus Kaiserbacteria bacterium RIFCSPLOWO2_01_FULL_55_25]
MKLRHISAVAALAVLLPFAASALTTDELQQQIQSLLTQITQLQQQLKQLQIPDPVQPPPDVAPTHPICPTFSRTLAQGATGDDVTQLQQYLGVSPTGYFGSATARAVAATQAEAGLDQVGIVGPQTRAWIYKRCGGGGWNQNFSASPTSGPAPLAVTFTAGNMNSTGEYSIDFGDGTSGSVWAISQIMCIRAPCIQPPPSMGHTYTSNGTYVAKLMYQPPTPPNPPCAQGQPCAVYDQAMPRTVGTVTIYVGGTSTSGAPSIIGIDGLAALNVGQTGTWTVHASVANNGNTNLRYSVIWGDEGVLDQLNAFAGNVPSATWASGSFTHAYGSAGTYRPTFTVSNNAGSAQASASVTVGGGGFMCPGVTLVCPAGQHAVRAADSCQQSCVSDTTTSSNFSASPTSGSAPLAVHFWADVSGSEYKIDFGDGTSGNLSGGWCPPNPAMGAPCMAAGADHTYTSAGTYTARLLQKSTCAIDTTCWVPVLGASSVTVTVYGTPVNPSTGTFSASPTSGGVPLYVTFRSNTTGTVNFGDGTSGQMSPNCRMGFEPWLGGGGSTCDTGEYFVGHTYTSAGTYNATFTTAGACAAGYCAQVHSVTILVTGSWTNCGSNGCSTTLPPSMYPNVTGTAQSSVGTTQTSVSAGSCFYNGQTYANGAVMSSAGTACTNPMGCGISSTYLVCQDGHSVVTLSPPSR